jgi:hypothetical protein
MPYFSNYAKDDQEGAEGQGQANGAGGFNRGAGGGAQAPGGAGIQAQPGAAEGASQKNAANTGSQYQSIDKYLGANADSQFGNQLAGKVQGQQQKGVQDQAQTTQKFNEQVYSSNYVPTQEQVQGAIADPVNADQKQYQQWMNQTYTGPNSLADAPSLQNQYWDSTKKAVKQTGQIAGNDTGQYSLLNSYFGSPAGASSYSSNSGPTGAQALDLSLAQHTAGYGDRVQGLKSSANAIQNAGLAGQSNFQNTANAHAGNVANAAQAARNAIGIDKNGQIIQGQGAGAIGQLEAEINQGVTDANSGRAGSVSALQQQLAGGDISGLTPEQLALFGLTPGQQTYNQNLGQHVSGGVPHTAANTMTPDQLARLKALQGLAGISPDTLASTTLSAGSPMQVDQAGVQNSLQNAKNAFERTVVQTPDGLKMTIADVIQQIKYTKDNVARYGAESGRGRQAQQYLDFFQSILDNAYKNFKG